MKATKGKRFWLGIDVGQEQVEAAVSAEGVEPGAWRALRPATFAHTPAGLRQLAAWAERQWDGRGTLAGICVESTGPFSRRLSEALARERPQWPVVSIINPKRSVDFGRSTGARDKTDRIDAAILAVYGAIYKPPPKPPLSPNRAALRELFRTREELVTSEQDLANMRRAQDNAQARQALQEGGQALRRQAAVLERAARDLVERDPALRRDLALLLSIRGIGFIVAWALLAELGDLRSYSRAQIVAYAGIYPSHHESGTTVHAPPRLVKGGCRRVRKALYNAARALFRSKNNTLRRYLDRLRHRGKKPMHCLVALMRKLLLIARSILIHGVPYDPSYSQG